MDVLYAHLEMAADGDGAQGVVYAEPSGRRHMGVKLHQPGHMEVHAQLSRRVHQLQALRPQHRALSGAIGLQLTGVALHDAAHMDVVAVDDADPALPEQPPLAFQVLLKALMLPRRDVVRLQVREDAVIEYKALCPMELQGLGGHLHHHRVQPGLHHLGKVLL